jgi:hypothetical protein
MKAGSKMADSIWIVIGYIHTPCSRVLLEKLTGLQLVKKFPTFYGTAFISTRNQSLS